VILNVPSFMPPTLGQIVETILYTDSVPKLAEWYTATLLITPFTYSPSFAAFSLPSNTILLLYDRHTTTVNKTLPGGNIPPHGAENSKGQHIAFGCETREALMEWESHLTSKGVEIEGTMDWDRGGKSIYFRDPEGHLLEIMTRGVWKVY
jgi:catechol-2,3-dioxygenase